MISADIRERSSQASLSCKTKLCAGIILVSLAFTGWGEPERKPASSAESGVFALLAGAGSSDQANTFGFLSWFGSSDSDSIEPFTSFKPVGFLLFLR